MLRNFLTLGAGETASKAIHVAAFLILARVLGKETFGQFGLAVSITSYLLILVQQGFDTVATREVSRNPEKLEWFARNIFGLRLVLAAAAAVVIGALAAAPGLEETGPLLLVLSITYATNALTPRWSFLAIEHSRPLAWAGLVSQLCFLAGALLIRSPSEVVWVAAAQVIGEAAAASYLWLMLARRTGQLAPHLDRGFCKWLFRQSWPISVSLLLGNMMYNFDIVALGWFGRHDQVGLYLACYRCVTVFTPLMGALQLSILPTFAKEYPHFDRIRARVRNLSVVVGTVLGLTALILTVLSEQVLILLFGVEFSDGGRILQFVAWSLPLQGLRGILRQVLMAFHQQHIAARNLAIGVVTNVIGNLALTPKWGPIGCAVSTVVSEFVFWAACRWSVMEIQRTQR